MGQPTAQGTSSCWDLWVPVGQGWPLFPEASTANEEKQLQEPGPGPNRDGQRPTTEPAAEQGHPPPSLHHRAALTRLQASQPPRELHGQAELQRQLGLPHRAAAGQLGDAAQGQAATEQPVQHRAAQAQALVLLGEAPLLPVQVQGWGERRRQEGAGARGLGCRSQEAPPSSLQCCSGPQPRPFPSGPSTDPRSDPQGKGPMALWPPGI